MHVCVRSGERLLWQQINILTWHFCCFRHPSWPTRWGPSHWVHHWQDYHAKLEETQKTGFVHWYNYARYLCNYL